MIRAEWTKLRTVRGWWIALVVALLLIIALGVTPGMGGTCDESCRLPKGPEGQEVTDAFQFTHRTLTGDGSITARISAFTGEKFTGPDETEPTLVPWAKAGLIVKDGVGSGSSYAAVLLTGGHGVRMQYDFTHDVAGPADASWLRLTRSGSRVMTESSSDGTTWQTVGTATLDLGDTVEIGMFATSPQYAERMNQTFGAFAVQGGPSSATAVFEDVRADGTGAWTSTEVGGPKEPPGQVGDAPGGNSPAPGPQASASERNGVFTLTGAGDIAPAVSGANGLGTTVTTTLNGTFLGLVLLVVIGGLFITSEYRRGLIAVTFAAVPARGRVFAAKALVIGGVSALIGGVAASVALAVGPRVLRAHGAYVNAVSLGTEVRLVFGTAVLLAGCAVLALAVGTVVRRSAVALTAVLALTVLPYLMAMTVLPSGAADWVLRVTPAGAFALQQAAVEYSMVDNLYTAPNGYFPLPWPGGLAVLVAWVLAASAAAVVLLRKRDVR